MYTFLFVLSLAYISYNLYHVMKATVPALLQKRLYTSKQDTSFEGLNNKRWDTPIGALSKIYTCSILFGSLIILTYLVGYETLVKNSTLYFVVLFASVGIACLTHWNLERYLKKSSGLESKF